MYMVTYLKLENEFEIRILLRRFREDFFLMWKILKLHIKLYIYGFAEYKFNLRFTIRHLIWYKCTRRIK